MRKPLAIVVATLFMCGLTGCMNWPEASSRHPDEVLFGRALGGIEKQKLDVACLSLETLLNSYPDSEYSPKTVELLKDPKLAKCKDPVGGEKMVFMATP